MGDISPINKSVSKLGYKKGKIDPFSLDDKLSYDPDDFYVRSTDGRGHNENVQIKLPPEVINQMSSVVLSGCIPEYGNSIQNLIRNAIVHQVKKDLDRIDSGDLTKRVNEWIYRTKIKMIRDAVADREKLVTEMEEGLADVATKKDWNALDQLIQEGEEAVEILESPYKEKAMQHLAIYRTRLKNR